METASYLVKYPNEMNNRNKSIAEEYKSENNHIEKHKMQTSHSKDINQLNALNQIKTEGKYSKGLHELFLFYSRQQKIGNCFNTFEDYYHNSTTLSLGEFLKFCKDFEIISKDKLNKIELIDIFKVNSS